MAPRHGEPARPSRGDHRRRPPPYEGSRLPGGAGDPLARFELGMAAVKNADSNSVFREADILLKTPGFESYGHLLRGNWFLLAERFEGAAREFGLATENPATQVEAYTRCGEALYRLRRYRDAEKMLLLALQHDESNSDVHRWLASTYYDLGAMSLAMEHLQIVGVNNPADGRPWRLRGLIQKDFEQFGQAVSEYREALKRDLIPDQRQAVLRELAECLVRQLQYQDALATLDEAAETPETLSLQAQCHSALGNTAEALTKADAALRLNPDHRSAVLTKAVILLENNHAEDAVSILEAAVNTYPNDFDVLFQLIKAWRLTGRTVQADSQAPKLAELEKLIDEFAALNKETFNDLDNAELRCQLGRLAIRLDRPALAGSWFQAALAIDPQHAEAMNLLQSVQNEGHWVPD